MRTLPFSPGRHARCRARAARRTATCIADAPPRARFPLSSIALLCALAVPVSAEDRTDVAGPAPTVGPIVLRDSIGDAAGTLRLVPPTASDAPRTTLGRGWRHDFDIVLTATDRGLVIRDGNGERREFAAPDTATGRRRHATRDPADGEIRRRGDAHVWYRPKGTDVTFAGSLPVRIESADGAVTTLHYDAGRLAVARTGDGRSLRFRYTGDELSSIAFSDGTRYALNRGTDGRLSARRVASAGECRAEEPDRRLPTGPGADDPGGEPAPGSADERCDTRAHPPTDAFADAPHVPGAIRVDARPASCRSHFVERYGTERGDAIERGLAGTPHYAGYVPTVRSFPIVDFVGAELRVVRSRDLASPTYEAAPDGLYARLLRDGEDIARDLLEPLARDGRVSVTEMGRTTTLTAPLDRPIVLELVVRHGFASASQRAQIARAGRVLAARHGIRLRVLEIP